MNHRNQCLIMAACLLTVVGFVGRVDAASVNVSKLCERVRNAFVFIGGGSGVVISEDGFMLTNSHVIGRAKNFDIRLGNKRHYKAKLIGQDVEGDLALLKLELKKGDKVPFLKLGDSEKVRVGDFALAVGNPFAAGLVDQHPTFTSGVISAVNHFQGNYPDAIVTDAAVNPGNSGGPLVDAAGDVIGINGQIATRWGLRSNTGLGFAISARRIKIWLPRLKAAKGKNIRHGRLPGLEFEHTESVLDAPILKDVVEGSHAEKCGFKPGDRILSIDGEQVTGVVRLAALVNLYPENHDVQIDVERDGKTETLKVELIQPKIGSLGIALAKPDAKDKFVKIESVEEGSAADEAGVKAGDQIIHFETAEFEKIPVMLQYQIMNHWLKNRVVVGHRVTIKIRRAGEDDKSEDLEFKITGR